MLLNVVDDGDEKEKKKKREEEENSEVSYIQKGPVLIEHGDYLEELSTVTVLSTKKKKEGGWYFTNVGNFWIASSVNTVCPKQASV